MIDFQSGRKDRLFFRNLVQSQYFLKGVLNFFNYPASYYKTLKKCYCKWAVMDLNAGQRQN